MIYSEAISGIFLAGRCSFDEKCISPPQQDADVTRVSPEDKAPQEPGGRTVLVYFCRVHFHSDKRHKRQELELVNNSSLIKMKW